MFDVAHARAQFPALATPWALLDNAGGSAPCRFVIDRVAEHMTRRPVQLGATYPLSLESSERVAAGRRAAAALVGADEDEVVLGPSTTTCVGLLAQALRPLWRAGDEVIVTNLDHEANVGPWRRLEATGLHVREWRARPETLALEADDLAALLTERTRLVAFTHCSNVVGTIHDVARLARLAREAGALTCVDGVAYAPHRRVDVRRLGVDVYLVSLYKVYGPHLGMLYVRRSVLESAANMNHVFVGPDPPCYRLEPGGVVHELAAALPGILEYVAAVHRHHVGTGTTPTDAAALEDVFARFRAHEAALVAPLLAYLSGRPDVRVLGRTAPDPDGRAPTVSFVVDGVDARDVPGRLEADRIAVRHGHFYAWRLVRDLGLLDRGGVVRASLVHYNETAEVDRLIDALDRRVPPRRS